MKQLRRGAAFLTALALLCTLTLPAAAAADTVTISSVQDFVQFSKQCTRDTWSQGITVELTADLDLSNEEITPVPIFQGTFHGNGHTISGLSLETKGSKVGLFRTLSASAVVEDLTVEGTLCPQGSANEAGLLAGENYGTVRRCTAQGSVTGQEDIGGLVGFNSESGSLISCTSSADVAGVYNVGGIAGENLGTVERCSNTGDLNVEADQDTPTNVGGIAGLSRGTIRGCSNTGSVGYQHVGYNMGGIAGLQSGEISECTNTGPIQGRKDVGGIAGQFEPYTSLTYGPSPSQQLADSMSALFDQLDRFASQVNDMVSRGTEDAQVIHDALSAIQDRTHAAGSEGHTDFRNMSDALYQHITAISDSLDALQSHADRFSDDASDALQEALDQSDTLLDELEALAKQADSGLKQSIQSLEDTVKKIRALFEEIHTHRQAILQELTALREYVAEVSRLIAAGDYEAALQVPFPSLALKDHITAIADALEECPRLAAQLVEQWKKIYQDTSSDLGQTGSAIDKAQSKLYRALTDLTDAFTHLSDSAQNDLDAVSRESDQIRDLLKDYTDTLGDKAQSAVDDINQEFTVIQDRVDRITQSVEADNDALYATSQDILDQMDLVRQAILDLSAEPELTVTDLTDEVDTGPGLIQNCSASGTVSGDSNTGGIVGAVSPELGDDPEATFDLGDVELLSDVYATLRAVIRACRLDGTVTVKNECGGGVAGRCEAGAILECAARGSVETGGDYCGGIAGRTRGTVERCAALVDLTAESWLGGVAGLAEDITDCRTMVRADSDGECQGAIAGQADGTLSGNRYLLEDLAGLDGVDYAQSAQGVDFAAFSQLSYIPADFLTFSYRFVVNGKTVAEIPFSYGEDLDLSQIPQAPQQNGQYGQWPSFPTQDLRRSMVLEAQFSAPASTLADQEGIAQILVEGTFAPDAVLTVQEETPPSQSIDGYTPRSAWSYTVTGSQADTLTVRLRAEGMQHPAAAVYQDGTWTRVDTTQDGSYLVFSAPTQGRILLMEKTSLSVWIVVSLAGAVVVLCIVGRIIRRKKRRSPESEHQMISS